jgi:hypothetical protein
MSRQRRRTLWIVGGVVFIGIAVVAATVSAWAGLVAAALLAVVQFAIAAKLPPEVHTNPGPEVTSEGT